MGQFGYRLVARLPGGAQWITVHSIEQAIAGVQLLGWSAEEVELYNVTGREDDPTLTLWHSEEGKTFSEVLQQAA